VRQLRAAERPDQKTGQLAKLSCNRLNRYRRFS
jgi:hypothetical protein